MTGAQVRGVGLLLIMFAAGIAAGIAIDRATAARSPGPTRIELRLPRALDQLSLTPAQRRAADSILGSIDPQSEAAMRALIPRLATIADSEQRALANILSAPQRTKLDSIMGANNPVFLLKHMDSSGGVRVDTVRPR